MAKIVKSITKLVEIISNEMSLMLKSKPYIVMGLPGGRSVKFIFREMLKHDFPWKKVHVFMVDERLVDINSKESNFRLVKENFLDKIDMPKKNIHPFIIKKNKKDFGAEEYLKELSGYGGYDLVILGVGEDCHVGALYPNYTIKENTEKFIVFHDSPKPPKDRMTASRKMLLKAKLGIALFIGEGKKEAYKKYLDKNLSIEECPAKIIDYMKKGIAFEALDSINLE